MGLKIMKKTYIIPEMLTVQLGTCKMMAESFIIDDGTGGTIDDPSQVLTRENKDVNLWDNEW